MFIISALQQCCTALHINLFEIEFIDWMSFCYFLLHMIKIQACINSVEMHKCVVVITVNAHTDISDCAIKTLKLLDLWHIIVWPRSYDRTKTSGIVTNTFTEMEKSFSQQKVLNAQQLFLISHRLDCSPFSPASYRLQSTISVLRFPIGLKCNYFQLQNLPAAFYPVGFVHKEPTQKACQPHCNYIWPILSLECKANYYTPNV